MWDNLTCWPATPRGQVVVLACPLIFTLFSSIRGKSPGQKEGAGVECTGQLARDSEPRGLGQSGTAQ